jgi:hypothetical protein
MHPYGDSKLNVFVRSRMPYSDHEAETNVDAGAPLRFAIA